VCFLLFLFLLAAEGVLAALKEKLAEIKATSKEKAILCTGLESEHGEFSPRNCVSYAVFCRLTRTNTFCSKQKH